MTIYRGLSKRIVFLFFIISSFFLISNSVAQNSIASPYSRYGIGEITAKGFAQNFSMGGTSIAMQNDTLPYFFINNGNPASYSTIRLTTADLGVNYTRLKLSSKTVKSTVNSASLGYVAMAFPLKKWCGASVGLVPYSSVGYKVADQNEITNIGTIEYLYEGSGGINQAYIGFGFKPFLMYAKSFNRSNKYARLKSEKNETLIRKITARRKIIQDLSLGGNVSYLFGGIENTRRSIFPSGSISFFNSKTTTNIRVSDINFDYGLQYAYTVNSIKRKNWKTDTVVFHNPDSLYIVKKLDSIHPYLIHDLKESIKIMVGATYSAQTNLNAKIDSLSVTYFNNSIGTEIIKDTVENVENSKGEITFPMSFGFGIGIKKGERLLVSADFAMQNWSSYRVFNQSQGLKNTMRVSAGVQYVPNYKANGKGDYYKRLHYRAGVRYAETALELKSSRLTEYAGTLGIGFPVGRNYLLQNFSMVNIGVEFGQRGTTTNGLIKENFFKATLGFTINDRWFVKPKFD